MIRRPCFRLANQRLSIAILYARAHRLRLPRSFDQGSGAAAVMCLAGDINGGLSPSSGNHGTAGSRQDRGQQYPMLSRHSSRLCQSQGQTDFPQNFTLSPTRSSRASSSFGMSFLRTTRHQKKHPFFFLSFSVSTFIAEPTPRPPFRSPWQTSEISPYIATLPFRDSADNLCNRHLFLFLTVTI